MTSTYSLDQYEAADTLLKYVYSGALGPTKGMAVDYALMRTTDQTFTYSVALEPGDGPTGPLDRYQIEIDRQNRNVTAPKKIEITSEDMQKAILAATGHEVASSCRFTDGGFSISYKVTVKHKADVAYVVQLRHHGNVASMDALMKLIRTLNSEKPDVIPMPAIYPIPGEAERQLVTGLGRQIAEFIPGVMAENIYPDISHTDRLQFVRKMALAWQACWDLPLQSPRQIGELIATDSNGDVKLTVGPDRHYSLGGPFKSVREWLKARLQHAVGSLERANGIDEFKEVYMTAIRTFVDNRLDQMPKTIEECPIVALHADMGLHNVIVSANDCTKIDAIIDWELCSSAPFLAAFQSIEMLFRNGAPNGFGPEYPHADELRTVFWESIPRWKVQWESQAAKDFMEWFQFAQFMKPEYCSRKLPKVEKFEFWAENVRIVERMLGKYGEEKN